MSIYRLTLIVNFSSLGGYGIGEERKKPQRHQGHQGSSFSALFLLFVSFVMRVYMMIFTIILWIFASFLKERLKLSDSSIEKVWVNDEKCKIAYDSKTGETNRLAAIYPEIL